MNKKTKAPAPAEKRAIGLPDPLEAAQESARVAQEGNLKLAKAVEALRAGLETIVGASVPGAIDRTTGLPVGVHDLAEIAVNALDAYSGICGQSWKRAKLSGATRAGDRSLQGLEA